MMKRKNKNTGKTLLGHAAPIVAAAGLWIGANVLVPGSPVNGQEIAGNYYAQCTSYLKVQDIHDCPGQPVNGKCTGYYEYKAYSEKDCDGNNLTNSLPCNPYTMNNVSAATHYGYCYAQAQGGVAFCQNGDEAPGYPIDSTVNNIPWCGNYDNSPPGNTAKALASPPVRVAVSR